MSTDIATELKQYKDYLYEIVDHLNNSSIGKRKSIKGNITWSTFKNNFNVWRCNHTSYYQNTNVTHCAECDEELHANASEYDYTVEWDPRTDEPFSYYRVHFPEVTITPSVKIQYAEACDPVEYTNVPTFGAMPCKFTYTSISYYGPNNTPYYDVHTDIYSPYHIGAIDADTPYIKVTFSDSVFRVNRQLGKINTGYYLNTILLPSSYFDSSGEPKLNVLIENDLITMSTFETWLYVKQYSGDCFVLRNIDGNYKWIRCDHFNEFVNYNLYTAGNPEMLYDIFAHFENGGVGWARDFYGWCLPIDITVPKGTYTLNELRNLCESQMTEWVKVPNNVGDVSSDGTILNYIPMYSDEYNPNMQTITFSTFEAYTALYEISNWTAGSLAMVAALLRDAKDDKKDFPSCTQAVSPDDHDLYRHAGNYTDRLEEAWEALEYYTGEDYSGTPHNLRNLRNLILQKVS